MELGSIPTADLIELRTLLKYSDSQERVPAGSPEGGEFAGGGGDEASGSDAATERIAALGAGEKPDIHDVVAGWQVTTFGEIRDAAAGRDGHYELSLEQDKACAAVLMDAINTQGTPANLTRGINVDDATYQQILGLRRGATLDMNLSSWTGQGEGTAVDYARENTGEHVVVFRTWQAQALSVSDYVSDSSDEWITDGRFTIQSAPYKGGGTPDDARAFGDYLVVDVRQRGTFSTPAHFVESKVAMPLNDAHFDWVDQLFDQSLRGPKPRHVSKRARTVTISSGGKARDDALNPIVQSVKRQLIALVSLHSNREKVSGLAFADAARAILRQGYAAAYLAGKKVPAQAATAPPAATPPDEYDRYADDQDRYGDLDDDGQDAVDDSSDGLNDRLLGLGALLLGGAVSAAMLDAWMGTYANSLNPLFEDGFQAGVNGLGEVQQATWVTEDDEACELCDPRNGMTWVGDEIDAAMPHPGEGGFGGPICDGGWRCRCSIDYEVVPADQATYSMGGYDEPEGDVEAMSTADLLKVWAITAKYELTDMPTSHLLTLRSILAKYSDDQPRDDHGRWTSGGGGIDTPAETSGNIFLDPWHGQEGDAAATEREGSRDLKVGDKVVSSDGRVGTISHLGGPHGDDPAVLSVRYGQDYETTVLSDIHLADTWETPKGWMAGGVINSDPVPPSLTAGPLMAREVMTKSDDSGRNYQIMYPPGMNPNDPQVVRLRSELTDSVKYNVAMEQDTGIKNAWSGRLILGTGSQDGQESVAAVKAWGCDIRLASGWQANIIAGTYHSSEAANNNDEQLTLTHELAHGISNTVNGPDEKDDYMVSPGWEEGVAEGYARAFTDAQVLGPDTHTSFFQQGSYQNWVDGLDTARATVAMYTNTTGFMNPTASDRLDFYRTLLTTPLNGRSSMVSTMLEPTGHAGIALVGTPLGSNAWAFVENLHPFGIGKTATPDKVPTPEESRALMPKVAAHLAEHPEDWNTVGREAEMLWLIATALDKSAKPAAKA